MTKGLHKLRIVKRKLKAKLSARRRKAQSAADYQSRWLRGTLRYGQEWALKNIGPVPEGMEGAFIISGAMQVAELVLMEKMPKLYPHSSTREG